MMPWSGSSVDVATLRRALDAIPRGAVDALERAECAVLRAFPRARLRYHCWLYRRDDGADPSDDDVWLMVSNDGTAIAVRHAAANFQWSRDDEARVRAVQISSPYDAYG